MHILKLYTYQLILCLFLLMYLFITLLYPYVRRDTSSIVVAFTIIKFTTLV
jgi:hypothetical protein